MASKKQVTKPIKNKNNTFEVTVLGTPDDYEITNTKDMDFLMRKSSKYHCDANIDGIDHLINNAFHNDMPPFSP